LFFSLSPCPSPLFFFCVVPSTYSFTSRATTGGPFLGPFSTLPNAAPPYASPDFSVSGNLSSTRYPFFFAWRQIWPRMSSTAPKCCFFFFALPFFDLHFDSFVQQRFASFFSLPSPQEWSLSMSYCDQCRPGSPALERLSPPCLQARLFVLRTSLSPSFTYEALHPPNPLVPPLFFPIEV